MGKASGKQLFISCVLYFEPQNGGSCITRILQLCNKALHGEPSSLSIYYRSASLLPAVDVNGVLLAAAAPLQAFPTVCSELFHLSTGVASTLKEVIRN